MVRKPDQTLEKALSLGIDGNGSLYRLMRQNHATIAAEFARFGAHWEQRAQGIRDAGLLDERGQRPSTWTVKQTWYRVCKDVLESAPKPSPAAPSPTVAQVPAQVAEYPGPRRPITFASPKTYPQEPK